MWEKVAGLLGRVPRGTRTLIETCVVGLSAGLAAVAFQAGIDWLGSLIYNEAHWSSHSAFLLGTLAIICGAALFTGFLLNKLCPEAAGSGIPQLKLAFWKDFGHSPPHIVLVKFVAGVVGIGGGLSLGREGPSVQIGGNLGSTVAGMLGVSKQGKRAAAAAGAAAALAAAFNAPLAGVAFVLEEILEDLNSRFLGPVLVAAVIGAFTVHAIIGPDPAFKLPRIEEPTWRAYVLMPVVAALAALIGVGFQRTTLALRGRLRNADIVPATTRPVLGALVTWTLGMAAFSATGKLGVFGIGYNDLSLALKQRHCLASCRTSLVREMAGHCRVLQLRRMRRNFFTMPVFRRDVRDGAHGLVRGPAGTQRLRSGAAGRRRHERLSRRGRPGSGDSDSHHF